MAELHMFPTNGDPSPGAKIARLEAHVFHLSRHIKELEDEQREMKRDREALLRYVLWRLIIPIGMLIGALASKGSIKGSPMELLDVMTKFFG
jgi:hypothetical protein